MGNDCLNPMSFEASADLSASQWCAVKLDSNGQLALPSAGGAAIGILYTAPAAAGRAGTVWGPGSGRLRAKYGGAVTMGDMLKLDASGRFVLASGPDVAAGAAVAVACESGILATIGSVVFFGGAGIRTAFTASETISTSTDASNTVDQTLLALATANHLSGLADGVYLGQKKVFRAISASGGFTHTITPTTMKAGQQASVVITATGQEITANWTATGWEWIDGKTAGTGTTADAGTINTMIMRQGLTIGAGAENRILPNGLWVGQRIKIAADTVGGGTSTVTGLFIDEDGSEDGVTATYNAALDEATLEWNGARWMGSSIISVTIAP
jgi:hypothetical protein